MSCGKSDSDLKPCNVHRVAPSKRHWFPYSNLIALYARSRENKFQLNPSLCHYTWWSSAVQQIRYTSDSRSESSACIYLINKLWHHISYHTTLTISSQNTHTTTTLQLLHAHSSSCLPPHHDGLLTYKFSIIKTWTILCVSLSLSLYSDSQAAFFIFFFILVSVCTRDTYGKWEY